MRKEKTAMIGSKTLKPGAGVKMEIIGDKTHGRDMRASPANMLKPCPFCDSDNLYIILESLADMYYYAKELYENCGGDDENRGRAPRMRGEIKNAEAILKKWGWLDV